MTLHESNSEKGTGLNLEFKLKCLKCNKLVKCSDIDDNEGYCPHCNNISFLVIFIEQVEG